MRKVHKIWGATGAVVLLGAAFVATRHRRAAAPAGAVGGDTFEETSDVDRRWRGFAPGPGVNLELRGASAGAPNSPGGGNWLAPVISPQQLEGVMDLWRRSILKKDAQTVVSLDQAFAAAPLRFGPELARLAGTDAEPRIRAFSTRVLGKYKNPGLAETFQRLLADKSPYVRQNAAWALGELTLRPKGKEAAQPAFAELRHLEDADSDADVRKAATEALRRLQ
jgi:hypothetical protein